METGETVGNRIGYQPNVDALEEVKVITGNGGGEYGNVGGASVVMTLKSGTNQFHGNVFEFLRNDKLDANGYFANRAGAKRNAFRRNIFGGTVGGPIKRNKAFFFMDYEGTEQRDLRSRHRQRGAAGVAHRRPLKVPHPEPGGERPAEQHAVPRQHHPGCPHHQSGRP